MSIEDTKYKQLELFDDRRVRLAQEVENHPELIPLLSKHPYSEFELKILEIATYCEVIVEGTYTPEDLNKLADILTQKLIAKRIKFIL